MPDGITPGAVFAGFWRWFWVGVGGLVIVAGIIIGGAHFGWWLGAQNASHQTQIIEKGVGYQTSETDDLNRQIGNVLNVTTSMIGAAGAQYAALHAERLGDARLACADATQITVIPAGQAGWVRANCTDGTLNPASPLITQGSSSS
jgi:hypothetical protein